MIKAKVLIFSTILVSIFLLQSCNVVNKESPYSVDSSACSGCNNCVLVCPNNAIIIKNNKAVIDLTKCTSCGNCVDACPTNAIY